MPETSLPESRTPTHAVVVLAAGASSRLGRNKLLLIHEGETLIRRAVRLAIATQPRDAVVVLGANADTIFAQVRDLPVRRVDCANWEAGMGASLHAGIASLPGECESALIVLCDQPALTADHLFAICAAARVAPKKAVASRYAARLGVPALLPRAWFAAVPATGDRGARDLFAARRSEIVEIANEALAIDIDRPDDLAALR